METVKRYQPATQVGRCDRAGEVEVLHLTEDGDPDGGIPDYPLDPRLDLVNHSPTGFAWGYGGSGPAQLALAILADALDSDSLALGLYQEFKWEAISRLEHDWYIDQDVVLAWAGVKLQHRDAAPGKIVELPQGVADLMGLAG